MAHNIRNFCKLLNCFQYNTFRQSFRLSSISSSPTKEQIYILKKNYVRRYSTGTQPSNPLYETLQQNKRKSLSDLTSENNASSRPQQYDWRNQTKKKGKDYSRMTNQKGFNQSQMPNNNFSINQDNFEGIKDLENLKVTAALQRKGLKINRFKASKSLPRDFLPLIHARKSFYGFQSKQQTKRGTSHQFKPEYDARAISSVILGETLLDLSKHKVNVPHTSSALTTIPSPMSCLPTIAKKSASISDSDQDNKSYSRLSENKINQAANLISDLDDNNYEYDRD